MKQFSAAYVPLRLTPRWTSLRRPQRRPERPSLWANWRRGSSGGRLWTSGGKSLWAGGSWRACDRARAWVRGSPSPWPGPPCRAGRGCGGSHPSLCPPPAAWCGEGPHGSGPPPARREEKEQGAQKLKKQQQKRVIWGFRLCVASA